MKMPDKPIDTNVIQSLMARVKTEEAKKGIQLADQLSDMILFHTRVLENGKKMENCGFAKVEVRQQECRIQIQLKGITADKGKQLIFSGIHCIIAV